jgi:gamma-glutamylcyclotransferase (GGCT)/AIG2-like uncharacterized protein YtfP
MLRHFFVYGTLKRGHLRSGMWPSPPGSIDLGLVRGTLLDLGAYPGLTAGEEWILGELWTLPWDAMPETLAVLDGVEGYDPVTDHGLYVRREISVWTLAVSGESPSETRTQAFTYLIADPGRMAAARRISPAVRVGSFLAAQWPDSLSRVPKRLEDE